MTTLLIDGDVIAYRAGFATEKSRYLVHAEGVDEELVRTFDDAKQAKEHAATWPQASVWTRKEVQPVDQALLITDVMIGDIRARFEAENPTVIVFLSGVGNYRNSIATRASYKGNRSGTLPPTHLKAIREHLFIERGAIVSAGEEADDLIGIASTSNPESIICSIDKDLRQLPGRHYDFVKKEETTVSPKEAVINFYCQVLSGDSTDNIPGLTGVGPVRARKALEDCKSPAECWERCLSMYYDEFTETHGEKYALEAARLVFVRREVNQMWEPPTSETKKTAPQRATKASRSRRVPVGVGSGNSEGSEGARN